MAEVKGLAAVCTVSLALLALLMVPGLLMQPTIVTAQTIGEVCSGGGVTGCYNCNGNPSGGNGCNGTTSPPAGWMVGFCVSTQKALTCTSGSINCGVWINCATQKPIGGACTTLGVCI